MISLQQVALRLGGFQLGPLDLHFERGIHGIIGPNGSGKSTMLKIIGGLLQPDSGAVLVDGTPLSGLSRREAAAKISLVPQELPAAVPYTLAEFASMGRYHRQRSYYRGNRREIVEALEMVDLAGKGDVPFDRLSGGEKRRACLARAAVQHSEWVLLDEPASYLDYRHVFKMAENIRTLVTRFGACVIIVSHDVNFLHGLVDSCTAMKSGKKIKNGGNGLLRDAGFMSGLFAVPFTDTGNGITPQFHG